MNKIFVTFFGITALLIAGFFAFNSYTYNEKQADTAASHKHAEFLIDGKRVMLHDGVAKTIVAPGSAAIITTRYYGNEVTTDLNDDGQEDVVFILTQETGGSGTFYYVVAALAVEGGYAGSQAYLLGDRIAPQSIELSQNPRHEHVVVVSYAERAAGEPMTAQPTVGTSVWLKLNLDTLQFGVVEQHFEGEADPLRMSLAMKDWTWISAIYSDGRRIEPNQAGIFTLTFFDDGHFSAQTDCNPMSGSYVVEGNAIVFGSTETTRMFCEGSQEAEFGALLENAQFYHFTSRGELVLDLKFDSGTVMFR